MLSETFHYLEVPLYVFPQGMLGKKGVVGDKGQKGVAGDTGALGERGTKGPAGVNVCVMGGAIVVLSGVTVFLYCGSGC